MTGPKLEIALQGLQDAIAELDKTILTTSARIASKADRAEAAPDKDTALSTEVLRAELEGLRQMISKATALIENPSEEPEHSAQDEVLH